MHKYNNQDHSMLTAMLAVRNIQGADVDVWAVNSDDEYHEEVSGDEARLSRELAQTQPGVPRRIDPAAGRSWAARGRRAAIGLRGVGGAAARMASGPVTVSDDLPDREEA
jgi:hypothetical protein